MSDARKNEDPKKHPLFVRMDGDFYVYKCGDGSADCDGEMNRRKTPLPLNKIWACGGCRVNW